MIWGPSGAQAGTPAGDISFDGVSRGPSWEEIVPGLRFQPSGSARLEAATPGVRIYDFKTLYRSLGYPDPAYFGSTPDEVEDVHTYTGKNDAIYQEINGYLRFYPGEYDWYGISPESAKIIVQHIDNVLARVPSLPRDLILFRGVGLRFRGNKGYEVNEEFLEKGYSSTSTSFKVARYFAIGGSEGEGVGSKNAVLVIYQNSADTQGILVAEQDEDEVILRHGTRYKVMASRTAREGYELYLVQACSKPCEASLEQGAGEFWKYFDLD